MKQGDITIQGQAVILPDLSKSARFSRDMSLASGNQSITGIGYTPRAIWFMAAEDSTANTMSIGYSFGNGGTGFDSCCQTRNGIVANAWQMQSAPIEVLKTVGLSYRGYCTFDTDGFTIAWTRGGAITGSLQIAYFIMK